MQRNVWESASWSLGLLAVVTALGCSSKPTTKVSPDSTNGTGFGTPGSGGSAPGAGGAIGGAGLGSSQPGTGGTTGSTGPGSGQTGTGGTVGGAASGVGGGTPVGGAAGAVGGGAAAGGATFTAVYAILMANCSGASCHVGAVRPGAGLSLADKATAYMNLVNAASRNCRGQLRVVPGMPNASVLVQALQHVGGCAPAMPQGKPSLSMADLNAIVAWITAGAMNN